MLTFTQFQIIPEAKSQTWQEEEGKNRTTIIEHIIMKQQEIEKKDEKCE